MLSMGNSKPRKKRTYNKRTETKFGWDVYTGDSVGKAEYSKLYQAWLRNLERERKKKVRTHI